METRIPLTVVGTRVLIFNLDHVKKLRDLGIIGILAGTLPTAPQQNIFLGLPLQLSIEEVVWLIENNHGFLINNKLFHRSLTSSLSAEDKEKIALASYEEDSGGSKNLEHLKAKLTPEQWQRKLEQSQSVINGVHLIKDNSSHYPNHEEFQKYYQNNEIQSQLIKTFLLSNPKYNKQDYILYRHLKEKQYYISPGLRFGGKFVAYPGDPLRYHAHLIVRSYDYHNDDIGTLNLVSSGRLATGVKKIWLIGGVKNKEEPEEEMASSEESGDVCCFSIEWSGFG